MQSISPTKTALKERVKRAVYQGGHGWGQMLVSTPELPSPCSRAGQRHLRVIMNHFGHAHLMQASPAMKLLQMYEGLC